jgi:hypothetical protein
MFIELVLDVSEEDVGLAYSYGAYHDNFEHVILVFCFVGHSDMINKSI